MGSGHYALLLTDLVDSTRAVERLGDAAASRLWEAHDRLARDLLRRWRGREIDKSDGFLLLFRGCRRCRLRAGLPPGPRRAP
jgi:class 3 adenylate cyclase